MATMIKHEYFHLRVAVNWYRVIKLKLKNTKRYEAIGCGGAIGSIQASMIIGRTGGGGEVEGACHLLQIDRTYSLPLTSSHIRPFMTNNTSQQRLITCCQWQRINHTINFHRVVCCARGVNILMIQSSNDYPRLTPRFFSLEGNVSGEEIWRGHGIC